MLICNKYTGGGWLHEFFSCTHWCCGGNNNNMYLKSTQHVRMITISNSVCKFPSSDMCFSCTKRLVAAAKVKVDTVEISFAPMSNQGDKTKRGYFLNEQIWVSVELASAMKIFLALPTSSRLGPRIIYTHNDVLGFFGCFLIGLWVGPAFCLPAFGLWAGFFGGPR